MDQRKIGLSVQAMPSGGERVTENIYFCPDGAYRWIYELDMLHTPSIFITICKVLGLSFSIVYLFALLISLRDLDGWAELWRLTWPFLILIALFFVISIIAYLIVAATYGWKYVVLFEMNDTEIRHIVTSKQFQKAQAIAWLSVMAGIALGSPSQGGLGLSVMTRNSSTSVFANVKSVNPRRRRHTIYVDQMLNKNQVYADDADFAFVRDFIIAHCAGARVR